ncbi:hypothetical protein GCM10023185_09500 [Hymenobacter saemangeumensis]|uniref:Outer membrane protein beta-barrel domain-containing protein n=1 Tax=Hymenobacter saemangeumensis TaxID=1084522 RepID=A0ABP8I4F4_9BACT
MLEEPEDNRLDQSLRDIFSDYDLPPARHVWTGIEQRLADLPPPVLPVRRRRPVPLPFLFALVALLAGLAGWLLPHAANPVAGPSSAARTESVTGAVAPATVAVAKQQTAAMRDSRRASGAARRREAQQGSVARTQAAPTRRAKSQQNNQPAPALLPAAPSAAAAAVVAAEPATAAVPSAAVAAGQSPEQAALTLALATPAADAAAAGQSAEQVPASLRQLVALERRVQAGPSVVASSEAARAQQIANLRAQRAELLRLQIHTDSLLVVLGDVPVALPSAIAAAPATAEADTARPRPLTRRWSLQLAGAAEQNALTLEAADEDKLNSLRRGHETGRPGVNAHLLAEYHLNPRWSLGAGLGYSAFGAELRINNRRTEVDVNYQTTTTSTTTAATSTYQTYSIRVTQVPMLNPIFNSSGQVLGYDTVYTTRQDTLFTTTVLHDSLRNTVTTTTPILTRREVSTNTTLRPNYRFATLPVLLRYRISMPGNSRFWTDVALGAQLQFFLGGTQAVTDDGLNFRTETISAASGPFRTFNLALSGSLALNYALSDRLSVSAAPSMRWQALSLYKAETGLKQQPTSTGIMLGMRWRL